MAGGRFLLLLLGVLGGFVLIEVGLRVLRPPSLRALHVARPDRPWLYGLRPGASVTLTMPSAVTYTINADGFRSEAVVRPKPAGTFRVVVLGDSLAFGYGVRAEEAFPQVLEARLRATAPGRAIEVVNLGVSAYNPYSEAALFADVGTTYAPDLVLVQFCGNDLNDPTLHFDVATRLAIGILPREAFPDPARAPASPPSRAARACTYSTLCTLLVERLTRPDANALGAAIVPPTGTPAELTWLRTRYAEIASRSAALGARFSVIVFPTQSQIAGLEPPDLVARVSAMARDAGWTAIDLLPAFRRAATVAPLFFDAWHPRAGGHRAAAEAILAQLVCAGLLPPGVGGPCTAPVEGRAAASSSLARTAAASSPVTSTFTR